MSIARSSAAHGGWLALTAGLALAVALLAGPAVRHLREVPAPEPPALRLQWPVPPEAGFGARGQPFGLALSPDGRSVAFTAGSGEGLLSVHGLADGVTRPLPGTSGARQPFWSPDGTRLAFFAAGELSTVALDGSAPAVLTSAPDPRGGVWGDDGTIIFAPESGGLAEVPDTGGPPRPLTTIDTARGDTSHRFPQLAGNGRLVVLLVTSTDRSREGVWVFARDSGGMTRLTSSAAHVLARGNDVLVLRDEALVAQRLDASTARLEGPVTFLSLPVGHGPDGELFASASATGLLLTAPPAPQLRDVTWFARDGVSMGPLTDQEPWADVRIALDGRHVALVKPEPMLGTLDIWITGPGDARPRRLSRSIDADEHPVWAPDLSRVAWVSARQAIVVRGALGELDEDTLWRAPAPVRLSQWTPDGRWLVFSQRSALTGDDLWLLPNGGGEPVVYLQTTSNEHSGAVSPDGRWIAFASDASGGTEVYLDRFPTGDATTRRRVTAGGGTDPRWRADGRELFVRRGREFLSMAVVPDLVSPTIGVPVTLLDAPHDVRAWDVSPDGQRLLLNLPAAEDTRGLLTMVVNWPSLGNPEPGNPLRR